MSGPEIREKINQNKKKMADILRKFVLTNEIKQYLNENEELRRICPHNFEKGICIYCDMKEEENND